MLAGMLAAAVMKSAKFHTCSPMKIPVARSVSKTGKCMPRYWATQKDVRWKVRVSCKFPEASREGHGVNPAYTANAHLRLKLF